MGVYNFLSHFAMGGHKRRTSQWSVISIFTPLGLVSYELDDVGKLRNPPPMRRRNSRDVPRIRKEHFPLLEPVHVLFPLDLGSWNATK
jgi:hypothetical protein